MNSENEQLIKIKGDELQAGDILLGKRVSVINLKGTHTSLPWLLHTTSYEVIFEDESEMNITSNTKLEVSRIVEL